MTLICKWLGRLSLGICFLLLWGCGTITPQVTSEENVLPETKAAEKPAQKEDIKDIIVKEPVIEKGPVETVFPSESYTADMNDPSSQESLSPAEENPEENTDTAAENNNENSENNNVSNEPDTPSNQELIDSAIEYIQASNDFWEQGDLDNAIDSLDKAYSLTLKVSRADDPEVIQQREDLRFTIAKRIIEVYSSRFTAANGSCKAIPLVMNRHVQKALDLFKGRERKFFLRAYARSGKYRPAIVESLKEAGLPEELSWLPFIESGFKARALSRARALGMWQFIASTGYKYGLNRDTWIDERMDLEKSTKAAIAYLTELHQIFGDWSTVLAAYNCGERRVLNLIKTQKINYLDNFWDLYEKLPGETAFYVPKFIALLQIINDPQAYGFDLPPLEPEMKYEEVTISKQMLLKTIAKHLNIDYGAIRDLNPELRQNLTPNAPYALKVPEGKGEVLLASLKDIPVWRPPTPTYVMHRVRSGESLSVIAGRYRTSVRAIMSVNGLRRKDYLKVGWKLKIPTRNAPIGVEKSSPKYSAKTEGKLIEYNVKKGDSLWKIANRFNTTVKTIRSLNRLPGSNLQIGQVLMISCGLGDSEPGNTRQYRVRRGDSPYIIAKKYKMNLYDFLKINDLTPKSTIFPGQIVQVVNE